MIQTPQIFTGKNLYQKLVEIRKQVKYMKKAASGYQFKYATEGQILAAIRDKMDELEVFLEIDMISLDNIECCEIKDKKEFKCAGLRATMAFKWTNAENPTDSISKQVIVQNSESCIETVGGLLTYANRYFLYKFFSVATDELDPDAFDNKMKRLGSDRETVYKPASKTAPEAVNEPTISHEQYETLSQLIGEDEDFKSRVMGFYKVISMNLLPAKAYDRILKSIEVKTNAKKAASVV